MKKLLLFAAVMFAANLSRAQWEPDVRLTNDFDSSRTSYNMAWCIAASGDFVHAVWRDTRDGNSEIYYKRSADGGVNWEADERLTNDPASSSSPAIAVSGNVVHVVWNDYRDGNWEIYYKRSTDEGLSWGTDTRLTFDPAISFQPVISISGLVVHLVWRDDRDGNIEIYYKRSTNGGITWEPDIRLTNDNDWSYNPSIATSGSDVHVVWNDYRDGSLEIYYKRSEDGGISWGADTRLTYAGTVSQLPSIAASGLNVHLVWDEYHSSSNYEIHYKRSMDGGISWDNDLRLTDAFGYSICPNLSLSGSVVHLVWEDDREGDYGIYYKRSEDGGINWGADTLLSNNGFMKSEHPSVSVSGSVVHVVWFDNRDGNYEIYYKRNPLGGFPVGTDNELAGNSGQPITIYPNPACTVLNIDFNSASDENLDVRIINIFGQTVGIYKFNSSKGLNQYKTDLNDFINGLYFIEFTTDEQKQFEKLLIRK